MAATSSTTVTLPPVFDLEALERVRDELLDGIQRGAVRVQAGGVHRVATNALLMLLAAAQTARRDGAELTVCAPSAPVVNAIEQLGLAAAFRPIMEA